MATSLLSSTSLHVSWAVFFCKSCHRSSSVSSQSAAVAKVSLAVWCFIYHSCNGMSAPLQVTQGGNSSMGSKGAQGGNMGSRSALHEQMLLW